MGGEYARSAWVRIATGSYNAPVVLVRTGARYSDALPFRSQWPRMFGLWTAVGLFPGCDAIPGDDPDSPRTDGANLEPGLEAESGSEL